MPQPLSQAVLIIEDNEDLRNLVESTVIEDGFVVYTASSGNFALEFLRTFRAPCLIYLDLFMPGMNGVDFLERLRVERPDRDRIVFVTGATEEIPAEIDIVGIVIKPFELQTFLAHVRKNCLPSQT